MALDYKDLSCRLIRAWRGDRTQLEASQRLGFTSNALCHWESGRRHPAASKAFGLAELDHRAAILIILKSLGSKWEERSPISSRDGVALLIGDLLGSFPVERAARECGLSTSSVRRWLSGATEPSLPSLLQLLDVTRNLNWVMAALAPGIHLPNNISHPLLPRESRTLAALRLDEYQQRPHSDQWLADRAGTSPQDIRRNIDRLCEVGLIAWAGTRWEQTQVDIHSLVLVESTGGAERLNQLQADHAEQLTVQHTYCGAYSTYLMDQRKAEQARSILINAFREIQLLVSSPPTCVNAEVFSLGIALLAMDRDSKIADRN